MKHPSLRQLQDYFENEVSEDFSTRIRKHLEECDRCSQILSEMAKVDIYFAKDKQFQIEPELKQEIFQNAKELLKYRKEKTDLKKQKRQVRKEQVSDFISKISEFREGAFSELKTPLLQTMAISLFLVIITKMGTTQTYIETKKIIKDDVEVIHSELLGEENETY